MGNSFTDNITQSLFYSANKSPHQIIASRVACRSLVSACSFTHRHFLPWLETFSWPFCSKPRKEIRSVCYGYWFTAIIAIHVYVASSLFYFILWGPLFHGHWRQSDGITVILVIPSQHWEISRLLWTIVKSDHHGAALTLRRQRPFFAATV